LKQSCSGHSYRLTSNHPPCEDAGELLACCDVYCCPIDWSHAAARCQSAAAALHSSSVGLPSYYHKDGSAKGHACEGAKKFPKRRAWGNIADLCPKGGVNQEVEESREQGESEQMGIAKVERAGREKELSKKR